MDDWELTTTHYAHVLTPPRGQGWFALDRVWDDLCGWLVPWARRRA